MLAVSAEFLQAIKNHAPQDVRLEFVGGDVIGTADIAITAGGMTYTEILNGETDVTFGRAVMSELSVVLINTDGRFTDFDFSREFTAKFGMQVGAAFEYVSLGIFRGERPEKVRGKLIDFMAHDRMSLFDKSAESFADGLTFPCTLGEIYTRLCDFCGVGYTSSVFTNSDKTFDVNPLENTDYTCREILGYIAEVAGSYARMSRDGAVELVWFGATDYTVTRTDRFELSESEFEAPSIDKLEVYNSYGDQLNTSGTGDVVYGISDNPFLYIENDTQLEGLQPYVDAIYSRITSLPAYQPSSFRAEFNPAVQCGDIISVVDDYDVTISFPVFVQTITWNGGGKTVYENTGGVIRQNAPFTQRELEQIKKKSLRAVDLYTSIDSYLNSSEGVASITQAVGGTFVTKEEVSDYVTESQLDTRIEAYINGEEGIASITESLAGTFVMEDELTDYATKTEVSTSITQKISQFESQLTLSASTNTSSSTVETEVGDVDTSAAAHYPFTKTSDGYYTSGNAGIANSSSGVLVNFNFTESTDVIFRCISYGEANFDYGIIGNVDGYVLDSNDLTNDSIYYSFKGTSSSEPIDVAMTIPSGSHFVILKYIKDGSTNVGGDYFKFKCITQKTGPSTQSSTLTLKSGSTTLSSANITFSGLVTFESLSTAGSTTINGANITTGKISADRIDTSTLYAKQVLLNTDEGNYPMISSELSSTNNTAYVKVGVTDDNGWAQFVDIYGTYIRFGRPGYDISGETNGFLIDMVNQQIVPNDRNEWALGINTNELSYIWARRHGFYNNTYLRVTSNQLRFYYPVGESVDGENGYEYDYITILSYSGI